MTAVLLVLCVGNLLQGDVTISLKDLMDVLTGSPADPLKAEIVMKFRLPKMTTCLLAGSALALAGLQMQTLFRNPLAGPDVLGLTSGAGLAVALLYMGGLGTYLYYSLWAVAAASAFGCLAVFLIMLIVAERLKDNASLLIVGLMVGAGVSSIVSVLQYVSRAEDLQVFVLWTFGSLNSLNWQEIMVLSALGATGILLAVANTKNLNGLLLGEQYARSIGINVKSGRLLAILSAGILTGGVTAFCGPIAFVGLAVPHLVRLIIPSSNHRAMIPAVLMGGSILMLVCDIVAQAPQAYVLPVNAITALVGAPVVIWVILKNKAVKI